MAIAYENELRTPMTPNSAGVTAVELLPCPFCGRPADFHDDHFDGEPYPGIHCTDCSARVPAMLGCDRTSVDRRWNIRALPAPSAPPPHSQASEDQRDKLIEKLHVVAKNVSHALMSFTPGGSEYFTRVQVGDFEDYYADADVCQRRVRERIDGAEERARAALSRQAPHPAAAMPSGEWQTIVSDLVAALIEVMDSNEQWGLTRRRNLAVHAAQEAIAKATAALPAAPTAQGKA